MGLKGVCGSQASRAKPEVLVIAAAAACEGWHAAWQLDISHDLGTAWTLSLPCDKRSAQRAGMVLHMIYP